MRSSSPRTPTACASCLRLSGAEHARLAAYAGVLARLKSRAEPLDAAAVRRFVAEAGIATVRDVLTATEGEPRPRLTADGLAAYRRFAAGEEAPPQFPLKGADLVRRGIAKGPEVGRRLERAREAWLAEGCPLDAAATARFLDVALTA